MQHVKELGTQPLQRHPVFNVKQYDICQHCKDIIQGRGDSSSTKGTH